MPYKDPEKKRAMDRIYHQRYVATEKGREALRRGNRAYYHRSKDEIRERRKDRARAYGLVRYHVKAGNIIPQPCEDCGASSAQAHHPRGYVGSAATDIEWLCIRHHASRHNQPHGDEVTGWKR